MWLLYFVDDETFSSDGYIRGYGYDRRIDRSFGVLGEGSRSFNRDDCRGVHGEGWFKGFLIAGFGV
jgi:hypothetical protein